MSTSIEPVKAALLAVAQDSGCNPKTIALVTDALKTWGAMESRMMQEAQRQVDALKVELDGCRKGFEKAVRRASELANEHHAELQVLRGHLQHAKQVNEGAKEEVEKWRHAASVICAAHIGIPMPCCPACEAESLRDGFADRINGMKAALESEKAAVKHWKDECGRLQNWKAQQLQVESEWNPNELAHLLGARLGESQRKVIDAGVRRLLAEREGYASLLKDALDALETCKEHYSDAAGGFVGQSFSTEAVASATIKLRNAQASKAAVTPWQSMSVSQIIEGNQNVMEYVKDLEGYRDDLDRTLRHCLRINFDSIEGSYVVHFPCKPEAHNLKFKKPKQIAGNIETWLPALRNINTEAQA